MNKKTLIIFSCIFIFTITLALTVKPLFWIIIPLAPASILIYLAIFFSKTKWVGVIISLACVLIFCSLAESYLHVPKSPIAIQNDSNVSKYITTGITTHVAGYNHTKDPILGFASKPIKVETAAKSMSGDKVIYDVLYSWDEKGRRLSPDNSATAKNLIILLGCSYTFGWGLEDKETFAWQLSELLGSNFQILNYSYSGYGSHQMLAILESDRLDYLKSKYDNVYAFYLTFPGIESRSGGMRRQNQNGPKYELQNNGTVNYAGQLNITYYDSILGQSKLFALLKATYKKHVIRSSMLDLHAALILKSKVLIKEKLESDFITVLYPNYERLEKRLAKENMEFINLDVYFDDFNANKEKYTIKYDGHPNFEANKVIAKAIYEQIEKMQK